MKIISWNIRGLNNPHKQDMVRNMIRDNKSDIVLLQETKMPKEKVESLTLFKNGKILGSNPKGTSRGVAANWNFKHIEGNLIF